MAIEQNFVTFKDNVLSLVDGVAGLENLTVNIGADKLAKGDPPPRIIWYLDPNEKITGTKGFGAAGAFGVQNPEMLATRVVNFDVEIWGKDREQVEALINHVVYGLHRAAWGSYDVRGGSWKGEDQSVAMLGNMYVLHAEMWIPITRPTSNTVINVQMPITPADPMAVTS